MVTNPSRAKPLFEKAFKPYAIEIGFLLKEWNDMQEAMADLFASFFNKHQAGHALASWHAVRNDKSQRAMLLAVAKHDLTTMDESDQSANGIAKRELDSKLMKIIKDLIENADYLGGQRDAATHAPVAFMLGDPYEFVAHHSQGNQQAKALKGKKCRFRRSRPPVPT